MISLGISKSTVSQSSQFKTLSQLVIPTELSQRAVQFLSQVSTPENMPRGFLYFRINKMMPEEVKEHHFPRDTTGQVLSATKQNLALDTQGVTIKLEDLESKYYGSARSNTKSRCFPVKY